MKQLNFESECYSWTMIFESKSVQFAYGKYFENVQWNIFIKILHSFPSIFKIKWNWMFN